MLSQQSAVKTAKRHGALRRQRIKSVVEQGGKEQPFVAGGGGGGGGGGGSGGFTSHSPPTPPLPALPLREDSPLWPTVQIDESGQ